MENKSGQREFDDMSKNDRDWIRRVNLRAARVAVLALAICSVQRTAWAACSGSSPIRYAVDATRQEVLACVNAAASGDTIRVPAGTATWSSPILLPTNKNLTLIGATIVNCTGTPGTVGYTCNAVDNTNLRCQTACVQLDMGASQRVSGFTLTTSSSDEVLSCVGEVDPVAHFRVDHNHLLSTAGWAPIRCKGQTNGIHPQGIWDHNRVDDVALHTTGTLHMLNEGNYQHVIWAQETPLGDSSRVVYIEANHFTGSDGGNINSTDGNYSGRVVIRFNRFSGRTYMEFHSPQGPNRGFQRWEVYNNGLINPSLTQCYFGLGFIRGGSGVFFNNFIAGNWSDCNHDLVLDNVRSKWTGPLAGVGPCDGTSAWDQNTGGRQGWRCRDQIGIGRDLSLWSHTTMPAWNQEIKPAYFWNNTKPSRPNGTGSPVEVTYSVDASGSTFRHIAPNRDFYQTAANFNGTSGVGMGRIGSRPATCTTGVAYWATDEGEWNSLQAGPDGRLYKCTTTNTWVVYYTPYTYPHPWQTEGGAPAPPGPAAPGRSLRLIAGPLSYLFALGVRAWGRKKYLAVLAVRD